MIRKIFFYILILFSIFIMNQNAEAGRPLNTDDTGVVDPGVIEIETAYEYVDATDSENNLSLVLTTGLMESLDLGIEIPYQLIDIDGGSDENGLSDISITSKWNWLRESKLFDSTLSFNYKSDNGNDEKSLGTGEAEYTILAIISKEISDIVLHMNVGPSIVRDGDDVFNYNMAAEWGISDKTTLVGEVFGSHNFQDGFDDNSFSGLVGFVYSIKENLAVDAGFTFGISDADPDFKVTTGLTMVLGES